MSSRVHIKLLLGCESSLMDGNESTTTKLCLLDGDFVALAWVDLGKKRVDEGLPTDRVSLFIATRTGKTPADRETSRMITTFNDAIEELPEEQQNSPSKREKIFTDLMGTDDHGRVRCMGGGVNKTKVFGKASTSQTAVLEVVSSVRADLERQLEEQRQMFQQQIEDLNRRMEQRGKGSNE